MIVWGLISAGVFTLVIYICYIIGRVYLKYRGIKKELKNLEERRIEKKKEIEEQKERLNKLNKELQGVNQILWMNSEKRESLKYEVAELQNRIKQNTQQIIDTDEKINTLTKNQKKIAEERLKTEMNLLRTLKMAEYKKEADELETKLWDDYYKLQSEITPLKEEVESYTAKRESIIEALKREKELQEKGNYYKINLSNSAINDIKYINEILDKLTNKKIISEVVFKSYIQEPAKEMINRVIGRQRITGIYRITDIETQECYIGQGVDVGTRLMQHIKGSLGIQSIADQRIHRAMKEKGIENWIFELLEECDREELTEREKFYIMHYKSNEFGFNKRIG